MKNLGHYHFLLLFLSLLGLSLFIPWVNPNDVMEAGIYKAYTESLIQDGDFNIINNIPERMGWFTSTTYNYPQDLRPGIAVFWFPFAAYGHLLKALSVNGGFAGYDAVDISQMIGSIFYSFLLLLLTARAIGKTTHGFLTTALMFFGSGLFYYFISLPTNNDLTAATVVAALIFYTLTLRETQTAPTKWLIPGLLAGLAFSVKASAIFLLPIPLILALPKLRAAAWYVLGLASLIGCHEVNVYLKNGHLFEAKFLILNPVITGNVLPELLFGPSGYLTISPIYIVFPFYLALYGFARYYKPLKHNDTPSGVLALLSLLMCVKVLILSRRFFVNEYFGARSLLLDFFLSCLILADLFRLNQSVVKIRHPRLAQLSVWGVTLLCSWTLVQTLYALGSDRYLHDSLLGWSQHYQTVLNRWGVIFSNFTHPCASFEYLNLIFYFPLLITAAWILFRLARIENIRSQAFLGTVAKVTVWFAIGFVGSTALNVLNNQRNVKALAASGFYQRKAVVRGPFAFAYEDFVSEVNLQISQAKLFQNTVLINQVLQRKARFLQQIQGEVIRDPLGRFQQTAEAAHSFWDDPEFLKERAFGNEQQKLLQGCGGKDPHVLPH